MLYQKENRPLFFILSSFILLVTTMLKQTIFLILIIYTLPSSAEESRIQVDLPPMMQAHMMKNMRDHLLALQTITQQLATQQFDAASDTAEQRLGMSSMPSHGANHMGKFMPKKMANIGMTMHRTASQFAIAAKDAEISGGLKKAFGALSKVMQQCVACHTLYKVHQ